MQVSQLEPNFEFIKSITQNLNLISLALLLLILIYGFLITKYLVSKFTEAAKVSFNQELETFKSTLVNDVGNKLLTHNSALNEKLESIKSSLASTAQKKLSLENQERKYLIQVNEDITVWIDSSMNSLYNGSNFDEYYKERQKLNELHSKVFRSMANLELFITDKKVMLKAINLRGKITTGIHTKANKAVLDLGKLIDINPKTEESLAEYDKKLTEHSTELGKLYDVLMDEVYSLRKDFRKLIGSNQEPQVDVVPVAVEQ